MSIGVGIGKGAGADKTGTLTEGKPKVTALVAAPSFSDADLLTCSAGLERSSEHPLAGAVLAAAEAAGITVPNVSEFASVTGKGVTGQIAGRHIALGNAKLMADVGVALGDLEAKADQLRAYGATALYLGIDGKPGGVIALADPIKLSIRAGLDNLRRAGIRIVMLTGDNRTTAQGRPYA